MVTPACPPPPPLPPGLPPAHAGRDWREALGEAWLARAIEPDLSWRRAWRRAAWRVWERAHRCHPLRLEPPAPAWPAADALPPDLAALATRLAALDLPPGRRRLAVLARHLGLPRGQLRRDLTRLARHLSGGAFLPGLACQGARLQARAAREGPTRPILEEARELRRLLTLVETPPELAELRHGLRLLVAANGGYRK